jgi:hypothetical protein
MMSARNYQRRKTARRKTTTTARGLRTTTVRSYRN